MTHLYARRNNHVKFMSSTDLCRRYGPDTGRDSECNSFCPSLRQIVTLNMGVGGSVVRTTHLHALGNKLVKL